MQPMLMFLLLILAVAYAATAAAIWHTYRRNYPDR